MWEERVGLEDHAHWALARWTIGDIVAVKQNVPLVRDLETRYHAQDGRFAAATWAKQGEEFALLDGQTDMIDGSDLPKVFCDAL